MYARAFPDDVVTLVDTYSTIDSGILNSIIVGKALIEAGVKKYGIRLDSGDLREGSK
jgi:nicotinate phosphoribosyltransferase